MYLKNSFSERKITSIKMLPLGLNLKFFSWHSHFISINSTISHPPPLPSLLCTAIWNAYRVIICISHNGCRMKRIASGPSISLHNGGHPVILFYLTINLLTLYSVSQIPYFVHLHSRLSQPCSQEGELDLAHNSKIPHGSRSLQFITLYLSYTDVCFHCVKVHVT